jgi:glycerol-3-phosphate dehydrogenase
VKSSTKPGSVTTLSTFSQLDRDKILGRMSTETFDLVIVGGGITGAGTARDAASRGMKVALVEARDFAEGTSSRSSKLIHGGIRYLENLEFHLVFEALSERRLLFELAPHLVHPLRFVLPLYKDSRVGMFKMGLGMWLYDALSMFEAPELHERLNAKESLERLPLLQSQDLVGSYVYSDAYMDDARLVIETLRSAVALGAACINHVTADDAELLEGKIHSIGCTDKLSGRRLRIKARHVVSTVGPWTDIVAPKLVGEWRNIMRPTKGVHLTFDRKRLQLSQAVVMASDDEKRIVFGIPRNEMTIIGTTDTDFSGDPADVTTTKEDVEYLLKVAGEYFPGAKLTVDDIIASYAGVRPLVDDGSESESKTSREHVIHRDPKNVTFVAGGKYTTYRLMAQQTVETALEAFSIEDQVRFGRGDTKRPLNDLATIATIADALRAAKDWSKEFQLAQTSIEQLITRHGLEAYEMLEAARRSSTPLGESSADRMWEIEARHATRHTMCLDLIDFYARRTPLFLARPDHGLIHIAQLSRVFAIELGWSDSKRQEEAARLQAYIRHELAWKQRF